MQSFSHLLEDDIVNNDIISLPIDENVSRIITLFSEYNTSFFPVVRNQRYVGVVSLWGLLKRGIYRKLKISSIIERIPSFPIDVSFERVLRTIVKNRIPGIVVTRNGKVEGIISQNDLLKNDKVKTRLHAVRVHGLLKRGNEYFLNVNDRIGKAKNFLIKNVLEEVYVVNKQIEGIVTATSMLEKVYTFSIRRSKRGEVAGRTEDIFSEKVYRILDSSYRVGKIDFPVTRVASMLCSYNISSLPVVNNEGMVEGIITRYDILRSIFREFERKPFPVFIKGLYEGTDYIREFIERKVYENIGSYSKKARILEVYVVIRTSEKSSGKNLYRVSVNINLDKSVHSGFSEGWNLITVCLEAIKDAAFSLSKTRKRIKKKRLDRERIRHIIL